MFAHRPVPSPLLFPVPLHRLLPWLLLLACALPVAPAAATSALDRIVAVVNDDVILESELDRHLRRIRAQLQQRDTRLPPPGVLERQVLERLIINRIQLQQAQSTGIRVDDDTLNMAIGNIARENNLSLADFRSILERDGYNFGQFREDIREEITVARLLQRQVDNTVTVTDREIENYLATQAQQGNIDSEFRLSHLLIATPEAASAEDIDQARRKAEQVLAELRDGADFEQTVVAYSDGQQALDGGDLGWRKAGQMPTLFADKVNQMRVGEISDLIRSPSGFHIIKLVDARSSDQIMIRQTHARHILIKPNELVSPQDARIRLEQLRLRIEGGDDFGELARSHSDDRGTSGQGGDLGWVSPGETVPEFEQVMESLRPGELSQPFESPFGWHIVQVLERRDYDGTEAVTRGRAREAIRQRKIEEEREAWLRRLRDEAYVEYRVDGL